MHRVVSLGGGGLAVARRAGGEGNRHGVTKFPPMNPGGTKFPPMNPGATMTGPVTVFGGTGFLGRRVVGRLREADIPVRVASRHAERGRRKP